ncbi:unnamed protein product [Paramecium primaurelia]|uniref:Uncharacterized protein n=1 Tax=Paramecium primaurelia TaxID=5886 RepID=A0A8S1QWS9_PARPR|nr:unnamed protein product [Paramecium primaurelia]
MINQIFNNQQIYLKKYQLKEMQLYNYKKQSLKYQRFYLQMIIIIKIKQNLLRIFKNSLIKLKNINVKQIYLIRLQHYFNNILIIQIKYNQKFKIKFQINKNKYKFNIRIYQNYQMIILQHLIIKLNKLRNIVIFLNWRWIQQNQMNQIQIQQKTNIQNQMSKQLDEKHQQSQQLLKEQQDKYQKQIDDINLKLQSNEKLNLNLKINLIQKLKKQSIQKIKMKKMNQILLRILKIKKTKKLQKLLKDQIKRNQNYKQSKNNLIKLIKKSYKKKNNQNQTQRKQQLQQCPKTLQFSVTYKGVNCQVTEGGKVVSVLVVVVTIIVFVNKQFQRLGKYCLHSKFSVQHQICLLELDLEILYQKIIIKMQESYMIRQDGYTYSHHNKDVKMQMVINYHLHIQLMIESQWKQVLNISILNGPDTSISQELYPCVYIYQSSKVKILDNIPN